MHVEQRSVELPVLVLEDPQVRHLVAEASGSVLVVVLGHPEQHAHAVADLADRLAVDQDARSAHALDDCPQGLRGFERFECPAVFVALRAKEGRHLVMADGFLGPTLLLEAAAEREMRVVVDRLELEDDAELLLRLREAVDAEVRDAQRLTDGRLLRLVALGLLEGDGGLGVQPAAICSRPCWKRS